MIPGRDISAIIAGTQPVAMQASRHKRDRVGDTRKIGKRDLSEHAIIYLFVNGVAEGAGPAARGGAGGLGHWRDGCKVLLGLMVGSKEDVETVGAFFQDLRARGLG